MDLYLIELNLYLMIIYLFMKYESNTPMYSKDIAENIFRTEIKGHNSDKIWWILSLIKLVVPVYEIYNPIHQYIQKISPGNHLSYGDQEP